MGAGWPCPHPTAVTPAHGAGIGFLQPHPGPAGRGDGVGTVTEPHVRTPGWPLGKGQVSQARQGPAVGTGLG